MPFLKKEPAKGVSDSSPGQPAGGAVRRDTMLALPNVEVCWNSVVERESINGGTLIKFNYPGS